MDIHNTSLGSASFYVLGGDACLTPQLGAALAYQNNLLLHCRHPQLQWFAVKMHSHASSHVSINLRETVEMKDPGLWFVNEGFGTSLNQHVRSDVTATSSASIQFS